MKPKSNKRQFNTEGQQSKSTKNHGHISSTSLPHSAQTAGTITPSIGSTKVPGVFTGIQYPPVRESILASEGNLKYAFQDWKRRVEEMGEIDAQGQAPIGLAKVFPGGMTNAVHEVQANLWWWRNLDRQNYHKLFGCSGETGDTISTFWERFELSAWMYEYRARFDRECDWDFGHPWPYCTKLQKLFLALLWPSLKEPTIPDPRFDQPWKFHLTDPIAVNLLVHDSVWIDVLRKQLRELRLLEGIVPLKRGGDLKRLSWLPIELLDRRFLCGEYMEDSERSNLSKACKKYLLRCCRLQIQPCQRGSPRKEYNRKSSKVSI